MAKFASIDQGFAAAGVDRATRHLFLCLGPDCVDLRDGEKTWERLKESCRALDLPIMRTKAGCLKVCVGGPWLLIYPEGAWYGAVTPERCDRILQEHIVKNQPIKEWIVRSHPLGGSCGLPC